MMSKHKQRLMILAILAVILLGFTLIFYWKFYGQEVPIAPSSDSSLSKLNDIPPLYPRFQWRVVPRNEAAMGENALYYDNGKWQMPTEWKSGALSFPGREWLAEFGPKEFPDEGFYGTDQDFIEYYRTELERRGWGHDATMGGFKLNARDGDGPTGSIRGFIVVEENGFRIIEIGNRLSAYRVFVSDVFTVEELLQKIER